MPERQIVKRAKRTREQTRGGNSTTPPSKRAVKATKKHLQPQISEWLTDDEIGCSNTAMEEEDGTKSATPPPSTQPSTPLPTQPTVTEMLSPITSQPGGSAERNPPRVDSSPISNALDLVASACSLRKDFATCEQIMTEKHHFLVGMLDSMNSKVSSFADQLCLLEDRIKKLEENENIHVTNAQCIYQAANKRQNDLERKLTEQAHTLNTMQTKCVKCDELSTRITQVEEYLSQKQNVCQSHQSVDDQSHSIAIHGLHETDDVAGSVQTLLNYMNLRHVKCISVHRTPRKPEAHRPGVVIAQLGSLEDKQAVLERKRFLRNIPQYVHVFLKSSKSHPEQVMDSNFAVVLKEMANGDAYYISDNGRIHRKNRNTSQVDYHSYTGNGTRSGDSYGGARPKTYSNMRGNRYTDNTTGYGRNGTQQNTGTNYGLHSSRGNVSHSRDSYRNTRYNEHINRDYRYESRYNSTSPPYDNSRHQEHSQHIQAQKPSDDYRRYSEYQPAVNRTDVNNTISDHTNHGAYSQQYNARYAVPEQHNHRRYATDQPITKN